MKFSEKREKKGFEAQYSQVFQKNSYIKIENIITEFSRLKTFVTVDFNFPIDRSEPLSTRYRTLAIRQRARRLLDAKISFLWFIIVCYNFFPYSTLSIDSNIVSQMLGEV